MAEQQWGLAPLHGVLSCARPGAMLAGPFGRPGALPVLPSYHPQCYLVITPFGRPGAP